jgi:hypothetical protein
MFNADVPEEDITQRDFKRLDEKFRQDEFSFQLNRLLAATSF